MSIFVSREYVKQGSWSFQEDETDVDPDTLYIQQKVHKTLRK